MGIFLSKKFNWRSVKGKRAIFARASWTADGPVFVNDVLHEGFVSDAVGDAVKIGGVWIDNNYVKFYAVCD